MQSNMVTSSDGRCTIVIVHDNGDTNIITESHPNFVRIAEGRMRGEDVSEWLTSATSTDWWEEAYDAYEDMDEFEYDEDEAEDEEVDDFEPAPVIESLSETIERYRREGRDPENLVRFMRRLAKNPSKRSREQLFNWTQAKDMTIDEDGYLIGYKGVSSDMLSCNAGTAFVNGVETTGRIPNLIGTVISMPRSEVQDDPTIGCSTGLHVGSWDYASSFGEVTLEVRIDPADVVSVPVDCGFQKLRCCEYEVIAIHETDTDDLSAHEPESSWDQEGAFDSFMDYVPPTFLDRLRDRILNRGQR